MVARFECYYRRVLLLIIRYIKVLFDGSPTLV